MRRAPALLLLLTFLPGVAHATPGEPSASAIERAIDAMTPDERVAQLLFVGFFGTKVNPEIRRLVADWNVGAIALYSANINSASQLKRLTADIAKLAAGRRQPFIALDQEGGEVTRFTDGVPLIPGNMALGATRSPELAERAGGELGAALSALGITMNLAPVLDVASSSRSAIGIRSFGSDPELVAELGAAFVRGQSSTGVVSVAKHFPGIGGSEVDSHDALPTVGAGKSDLLPFRTAIGEGVEAIMVGHAAVPAVDGSTPASQSAKILDVLRRDLQFDGVIVTDVVEMDAIAKNEGVGRVAVQSVVAGADLVMVLWHEDDREDAFRALKAAYASGELSETRLRQSLRRILRLKLRRPAPPRRSDETVADEIARKAVTIVRNDRGVLPIIGRRKVVYVGPPGPLSDALPAAARVELPVRARDEQIDSLIGEAREAIAGASLIVGAARNRTQAKIIAEARATRLDVPFVMVSLGSPSLLEMFPTAAAAICAYGYLDPSQRATAQVLTGTAEAPGILPVSLPSGFVGASVTP
jgi:beta-N-acetylhexosaminidase